MATFTSNAVRAGTVVCMRELHLAYHDWNYHALERAL